MNFQTLPAQGGMTLSPRRLLGAYLEETRCEGLRLVRNASLVIPTLLMPLALYGLFAGVIVRDAINKDSNLGIFMFTAFAVMAISMPGLFGLSSSLALEREMGLMQLKRVQPAPPGSWLVAKILCGIGFGAVAYLPVVTLALLLGKLPLAAPAVFDLSVTLLACTIPFCALGLMMGSLVRGSAAPGFANLVYLPGCYLSGMFFPLPPSLHWQAPLWPQFHVTQLAMHAAGADTFQFIPLLVALGGVVGYTVLFSTVAIWRLARSG